MTLRKVATLAVAALLTACSSDGEKADNRSLIACRNFSEVAADYNDDALSGAQLTARLQAVREDAQDVATDRVQAAADAMVRAARADDGSALASAVREMSAACKASGN